MNAASLSPDDESFLDEVFDLAVRACGTGAALDLDALLIGHEHLRGPALRMLENAREVAVLTPHQSPARDLGVVAGFTVLEEVGRGGMGTVYRARQESLGRVVALKVLAPSLIVSARSRERFGNEAKALGRVHHPHVVAVHEVIAQDELCAYAMEWVDGTTLAKAIAARDPSLDVAAVARLGVTVARALTAVHAAGLVHRDVKPSNILLRRDGTPVLSDFGLVLDAEHSMHTATGEFLGTAAYAAPEQLRGAHDEVGPWSDVYGLGVTLYAALTGQTPFATTSTAEMLRRIESGLGTPLRKLEPRVPRDVATIVAKATDRDPQRRYRTATELADDLERFLRFTPIVARRIGPALRLARLARRNRGAFVAATLATLLVLSLATAFVLDLQRRLTSPGRFREELRQARLCLLHPDLHHLFFIAANMPGSEAVAVPLPSAAVMGQALARYEAALLLVPDSREAALECAVVAVVRALLAHEAGMPPRAESLRPACPHTFAIAQRWLAAGRPTAVDVASLQAMPLTDRRHLGLLAFLCTRATLCMQAWEALDAQPDFDDPLVSGALGVAWLSLDRGALAVPRLSRARQEFPEASFLTLDLADALVRSGDHARARAMLDIARRDSAMVKETEDDRIEADLCVASGDRERARALYLGMWKRGPTASFHLARFLADNGDAVGAVDCLGLNCLAYPTIQRYEELLLRVVDPVWCRLGLAQQADAVVAAAHGRDRHMPLYAIAAALRDRGWLADPPVSLAARLPPVSLRNLMVTRAVIGLLAQDALRARPRAARWIASLALLCDVGSQRSYNGVVIALVIAQVVRAGTLSDRTTGVEQTGAGPHPGPWEKRAAEVASPGLAARNVSLPAIASAGDIDRDGCDDVLVGDPSARGGDGQVWLCSGRSGQVLHTFTGRDRCMLGGCLSTVGDVDRDGVTDVVIGARGRALVCSGADGSVIHTFSGRTAGDAFGSAVAAAGDVDRDGFADLVVGATGSHPLIYNQQDGYAMLFSGRTGGVLHAFAETCSALDGGQDVDGDGVPDVLLGTRHKTSPYGFGSGRVFLFSGATGAALWTDMGPCDTDALGTSVTFLGDVNGDGRVDWAAGAPQDGMRATHLGSGYVRVYGGPDGTLLRTLGGCGPDIVGFGAHLSRAGDVDGDGLGDLLVGAAHDGVPEAGGYVEIFSPGSGFALLRRISGPPGRTGFGRGVCGGLDVDGDGRCDFVIGATAMPGFERVLPSGEAR